MKRIVSPGDLQEAARKLADTMIGHRENVEVHVVRTWRYTS